MARTMKHQTVLLLDRLGRHEPHIRPCDRFAKRLGVHGANIRSRPAGPRSRRRIGDDPVSDGPLALPAQCPPRL